MEAGQVVSAHEPDKVRLRRPFHDGSKRVRGISQTKLRLDVGHDHAWVCGERPRRGKARVEIAMRGLERIAARDDPPDPVEAQPPHSGFSNMHMAGMGRVEASAKQANAQAVYWSRKLQVIQGRVCPVPLTTYL